MSALANESRFTCRRIISESCNTVRFFSRCQKMLSFCNSPSLYLKSSSVFICPLLLPWSIQNQRLAYQDQHLLSHLLSFPLRLLHFPTGEVYQYPRPWVLLSESVLWGNIPIVTITLGMVGREVHLQGYFQDGRVRGGTVNHIDDCAVPEEIESLNNVQNVWLTQTAIPDVVYNLEGNIFIGK